MKRLNKQLEKWINQVPWISNRNDIIVTIKDTSIKIEAKDKKKGAKYNEKVWDIVCSMIYGARYFTEWKKLQIKKGR